MGQSSTKPDVSQEEFHPPPSINPTMSNSTTTAPPAPVTRSATKAAFTHIVDIVLDNVNVANASDHFGIADIRTLDDAAIEGLTYPDPDPNITQPHPPKRGEIGLLQMFIHYVRYLKRSMIPMIINGQPSLKICLTNFSAM
jgi:hypothetical protein